MPILGNDKNVAFMSLQQHGCDIHVVGRASKEKPSVGDIAPEVAATGSFLAIAAFIEVASSGSHRRQSAYGVRFLSTFGRFADIVII